MQKQQMVSTQVYSEHDRAEQQETRQRLDTLEVALSLACDQMAKGNKAESDALLRHFLQAARETVASDSHGQPSSLKEPEKQSGDVNTRTPFRATNTNEDGFLLMLPDDEL